MDTANSSRGLYCYECNAEYPDSEHAATRNSEGDRVCCLCGSDFIELINVPSRPAPPPMARQADDAWQEFVNSVSNGVANGPRIRTFTNTLQTPGGANLSLQVVTTVIEANGDNNGEVLASVQNLLNTYGNGSGAMVLHMGENGLVPVGGTGFPGGFNLGDFGAGMNMEELLAHLAAQHQPRFLPASREAVEQLPKLCVQPSGSDTDQSALLVASRPFAAAKEGEPCAVCHDEFAQDTEVLQLPCKHCFHEGCIKPWLETHNTCPVCRWELPAGELPPPQEGHDQATLGNTLSGGGILAQIAQSTRNFMQQVGRRANAASQHGPIYDGTTAAPGPRLASMHELDVEQVNDEAANGGFERHPSGGSSIGHLMDAEELERMGVEMDAAAHVAESLLSSAAASPFGAAAAAEEASSDTNAVGAGSQSQNADRLRSRPLLDIPGSAGSSPRHAAEHSPPVAHTLERQQSGNAQAPGLVRGLSWALRNAGRVFARRSSDQG